jgi:hypothetical protein
MKLARVVLLIGIFTILAPSISAQVQPPPGWRFPQKNDIKDDWEVYKFPVHIVADFNGDGFRDEAWILLRQADSGWGLFVFLGAKQRNPHIIKLVDASEGTQPQRYSISLAGVSRKKWRTACGKGYFACKPGEPTEIEITLPSIEFCYTESSCSIFLWNLKANAFSKYQMSD